MQTDLYRLGVTFSVSTHRDPPPRPSMTLQEAQRDPEAFLVGFVETERSVHFDPELARRDGSYWRSKMPEPLPPRGSRERSRLLAEAAADAALLTGYTRSLFGGTVPPEASHAGDLSQLLAALLDEAIEEEVAARSGAVSQ